MTSAHFSWSAPESRRLHEPRAPAWTELAADYIESFDTQGVSKEPDPGALKAKLHKELTADGLPPLQVIYACSSFVESVSKRDFVQSISRKGNCWDKAVAESFFHLLNRVDLPLSQPLRVHRDLLQPRKESLHPVLRITRPIRAAHIHNRRLRVSVFPREYQTTVMIHQYIANDRPCCVGAVSPYPTTVNSYPTTRYMHYLSLGQSVNLPHGCQA